MHLRYMYEVRPKVKSVCGTATSNFPVVFSRLLYSSGAVVQETEMT